MTRVESKLGLDAPHTRSKTVPLVATELRIALLDERPHGRRREFTGLEELDQELPILGVDFPTLVAIGSVSWRVTNRLGWHGDDQQVAS